MMDTEGLDEGQIVDGRYSLALCFAPCIVGPNMLICGKKLDFPCEIHS